MGFNVYVYQHALFSLHLHPEHIIRLRDFQKVKYLSFLTYCISLLIPAPRGLYQKVKDMPSAGESSWMIIEHRDRFLLVSGRSHTQFR